MLLSAFYWLWLWHGFLSLSGKGDDAVCYGASPLPHTDVEVHFRHAWRKARNICAKWEVSWWLSIVIWALGYYRTTMHIRMWPNSRENSYIGRIGKAEPVIEPLGFDWKLGVGILSV